MKNMLQVPMIFDDVQFGIDIRDARIAQGMTQQLLGAKVGYKDGNSISRIECAVSAEQMTVRRYMALCNLLELNPMHYWQTDEPWIDHESVESWWNGV